LIISKFTLETFLCAPAYNIYCLEGVAVRFGVDIIEYTGTAYPPALLVNGVSATVPLTVNGITIASDPSYGGVLVTLPNTATITMSPYYLSIKVPTFYYNSTRGLCGTWNNANNLFIARNDSLNYDFSNVQNFITHWGWQSGDPTLFSTSCSAKKDLPVMKRDSPIGTCPDLTFAISACKPILETNLTCAVKLDVLSFYLNCLSDYCATQDITFVSNNINTLKSSCAFAENGLQATNTPEPTKSSPSSSSLLTVSFFLLSFISLFIF